LFDIDDTTSLRVGRDGSGGVPVDGDPVGMMMDVSGAGGSTMAAYLAGATELVTNGTFDTDSDWTKPTGWSIGGGVASYDGSGVQYNKLYQILSGLVIGKVHAITFTVSGLSGDGSINFGFGNDGGSGFVNPQQTYNSDGTYTRYMTASITNHSIIVQCNNAGQTVTVDNVSVKALPGYVAIAPSDSARPNLASYNSPISSREVLTTTYGWNITDGGRA
jgi:hypothetical protein